MISAARSFSRAARYYHEHAALHREIAARTADAVPACAPRFILDAGCGTGFLTVKLAERFPEARIDAVDFAPGMIAAARELNAGLRNVNWQVEDIHSLKPAHPYDLIASSAALQWMQPLDKTFQALAGMLAANGRLCAAVLVDGTLRELREARRKAVPHKEISGRLPSGEETLAALDTAGFKAGFQHRETLAAEYPSAEEAVRAIKSFGFGTAPLSAAPAPLSRRELCELIVCYQSGFQSASGSVPMSFDVLYFTAQLR